MAGRAAARGLRLGVLAVLLGTALSASPAGRREEGCQRELLALRSSQRHACREVAELLSSVIGRAAPRAVAAARRLKSRLRCTPKSAAQDLLDSGLSSQRALARTHEGRAAHGRSRQMRAMLAGNRPQASSGSRVLADSVAPEDGGEEDRAWDETCVKGTYQDPRTLECHACHPGTFATQPYQTACSACPIGFVAPEEGAESCIECPAHTQQPMQGQTRCLANLGYYNVGSNHHMEVLKCGKNMITAMIGAESPEQCLCVEGSLYDGHGCDYCPEGLECPGDTARMGDSCPLALTGFHLLGLHRKSNCTPELVAHANVYRCLSEEACPGGVDHCGAGRDPQKPACGMCLPSYEYDKGGPCRKCHLGDRLLVVGAGAGVLLLLMFVSPILGSGQSRLRRSTLLMATTLGIVVSTVQYIGVIVAVDIQWGDPLDSMLKLISEITFDVEIMRVGCTISLFSHASLRYLVRLLCVPFAGLVVALIILVRNRILRELWHREERGDVVAEIANLCGLLLVSFYISICTLLFTPMTCYSHPSQEQSLVIYPYVICWNTSEHQAMLAFALTFLCILFLPATALIIWATWRYHKAVVLQEDRFLACSQALFLRFKPSCHYWCIGMLLRSMLLSLMPVCFRDSQATQLVLLASIFTVFVIVEASVLPSRLPTANHLNTGVCGLMILVLICGAVASDVAPSGDMLYVGGGVLLMAAAGVLASVMLTGLQQRLRADAFSHFICHHKEGAAAQSRMLQLLIEKTCGTCCFIDADHLQDLDCLYDTVRSSVGTLVVYLTRHTLTRAWCVGEIATARANRKPIRVVKCPDFWPMSDDMLEGLALILGQACQCLTAYGIALDDATEALRYIHAADALEVPECPRTNDFRLVANNIMENSTCPRRESMLRKIGRHAERISNPRQNNAALQGVMLCSPVEHPEATAGAYLLACMLAQQETVREDILLLADLNEQELGTSLTSHKFSGVVVLLSQPTLRSLPCTRVLCHAVSKNQLLVPVLLPGFDFPTEAFYSKDLPLFCASHDLDAATVAQHWRGCFKLIAIHFNTHASKSHLLVEANEVAMRLQRRKGSSKRSRRSVGSDPAFIGEDSIPTASLDINGLGPRSRQVSCSSEVSSYLVTIAAKERNNLLGNVVRSSAPSSASSTPGPPSPRKPPPLPSPCAAACAAASPAPAAPAAAPAAPPAARAAVAPSPSCGDLGGKLLVVPACGAAATQPRQQMRF